MKLRNLTRVAISVVDPKLHYVPDNPKPVSPTDAPMKQLVADKFASLPRRVRRHIDRNAKRALRKYKKQRSAA